MSEADVDEEEQGSIRIGDRNINNLRYADDTDVITESEDELSASWVLLL